MSEAVNAMEKKKARLRVISIMVDQDGDRNEIRNAHTGTCMDDGTTVVLEYDDVQDGERARIELTARSGHAQMVRKGMTSAKLVFTPGQRTSSAYVTMYGEIPVMVDTRQAVIMREENGGDLLLHYDVYVGGEMTARTQLRVTWRV
ncbi:MAG: DUF1934 domain-containing protein [Clostridia bacterium]|nr:DUF1934 domain-containing protein [Clostridia bacterium]